jgi:hypothetical protein
MLLKSYSTSRKFCRTFCRLTFPNWKSVEMKTLKQNIFSNSFQNWSLYYFEVFGILPTPYVLDYNNFILITSNWSVLKNSNVESIPVEKLLLSINFFMYSGLYDLPDRPRKKVFCGCYWEKFVWIIAKLVPQFEASPFAAIADRSHREKRLKSNLKCFTLVDNSHVRPLSTAFIFGTPPGSYLQYKVLKNEKNLLNGRRVGIIVKGLWTLQVASHNGSNQNKIESLSDCYSVLGRAIRDPARNLNVKSS